MNANGGIELITRLLTAATAIAIVDVCTSGIIRQNLLESRHHFEIVLFSWKGAIQACCCHIFVIVFHNQMMDKHIKDRKKRKERTKVLKEHSVMAPNYGASISSNSRTNICRLLSIDWYGWVLKKRKEKERARSIETCLIILFENIKWQYYDTISRPP